MSGYLGLVGMGVEHGIVCIDCFFVLICYTGDVLCLCMLVCVNFRDEILLRGEECKTREKFNFSGTDFTVEFVSYDKTDFTVENRKISRSRMTKRTLPLNWSRQIWLPCRIPRQSEFHVFQGIGCRVTHGMTCGALV